MASDSVDNRYCPRFLTILTSRRFCPVVTIKLLPFICFVVIVKISSVEKKLSLVNFGKSRKPEVQNRKYM